MRGLFEIFVLEFRALARSKTLAMLAAASVGWTLAFPHFVRGDGTPGGFREVCIHYSLGGVFALLAVALLASATGSVAKERERKRLALTLVRPVPAFAIAYGKILAHVAAGALVAALACAALAATVGGLSRPCSHVLRPVMQSPREEALEMYSAYMASPDTPEEVRKAPKPVVLRLLENKAVDRYDTIATNETAKWKFDTSRFAGAAASGALPSVRMRFTNDFDVRQEVRGEFRFGGLCAAASNITQAILVFPLRPKDAKGTPGAEKGDWTGAETLEFDNRGRTTLMLRPRRDVELLLPADSFFWNLLRSYLAAVAALALVVAFGVALSSALGRSVAAFVAFVALAVGEMSPSIVEQYPDSLEKDFADRVGLAIARFAAKATRPVSALSPFESLAKDECVEWRETLAGAAANMVLAPAVFALLAALAIPRKGDSE